MMMTTIFSVLLCLALALAVSLLVLRCFFPKAWRLVQLARIWTSPARTRRPDAIAEACGRSGPIFIKLGQWLSTRRDLLPVELCDAIGVLHEQVPCFHSRADKRHAETTIPGLVVGELLGGGCIAQVYAGTFRAPSGSLCKVAVKVRRQDVSAALDTDLAIFLRAAQFAEWMFPGLKWLSLADFVLQFSTYLRKQTDLRMEAANLQRFEHNIEPEKARVPGVHAATETVLVTDLVEGISLSKFLQQKHPEAIRRQVFDLLTDLICCMCLRDRFVHGDLHPGNIMVSLEEAHSSCVCRKASIPVITLIDAGIAIEQTRYFSDSLSKALRAATWRDADGFGRALAELHEREGLCTHVVDMPGLIRELGCIGMAGCFPDCEEEIWSVLFRTREEYLSARTSEYFNKLLDILSSHKVRVCPNLWSMTTAFALIEGSMKELGYAIDIVEIAAPYLFTYENITGQLKAVLLQSSSSELLRSLLLGSSSAQPDTSTKKVV